MHPTTCVKQLTDDRLLLVVFRLHNSLAHCYRIEKALWSQIVSLTRCTNIVTFTTVRLAKKKAADDANVFHS
jgi:hypothetical protein